MYPRYLPQIRRQQSIVGVGALSSDARTQLQMESKLIISLNSFIYLTASRLFYSFLFNWIEYNRSRSVISHRYLRYCGMRCAASDKGCTMREAKSIATKRLYKRVCPLVGPSVQLLFRPIAITRSDNAVHTA